MKPALLVVGLALVACTHCIVPDYDIVVTNEDIQNKNAVRLVEPIELTEEALLDCEAAYQEADDTKEGCPQPGTKPLPHFLDPALPQYNFCACDEDEVHKQLAETTLYAEDRDKDRDGKLDDLFAALQLDLDPDDPSPHQFVRYTDFISPIVNLRRDDQLEYLPVKRPDPQLRVLKLGDGDKRVDLCNDVDSLDKPLARGYHTLRLIVTDRPWFTDDSGPKFGVPDLASGATYDTLTYVFHCDDKTNPDDDHCITECVPRSGGL